MARMAGAEQLLQAPRRDARRDNNMADKNEVWRGEVNREEPYVGLYCLSVER